MECLVCDRAQAKDGADTRAFKRCRAVVVVDSQWWSGIWRYRLHEKLFGHQALRQAQKMDEPHTTSQMQL
jgi:hypothetical protein